MFIRESRTGLGRLNMGLDEAWLRMGPTGPRLGLKRSRIRLERHRMVLGEAKFLNILRSIFFFQEFCEEH